MPSRVRILGVPVDCVDTLSAMEVVDGYLEGDRAHNIIAVNSEKVMTARTAPQLLAHLERTDLLIPDGIGVVWAAGYLGLGRMQRVAGADLMPEICELAALKGKSVFLYGGKPEVVDGAVKCLRDRMPDLVIAGSQHGYLEQEKMADLVERINQSGAAVLFIALGSPKQEEWMRDWMPGLNVKVCQGVGGTFDVLAGTVARAPRVFQRMHLEWFYRLLAQPSRISRQVVYVRFVFDVIKQKFGGSPGVRAGQ